MTLRGSNHKTAAAWNRGLAIRLLRRHGTLSRNDLSRATHLQGSTLSYIVRELLEKNLVRVVGKRESRQVGQKQVLLQLNPELGWTLGVALRPGQATLVLLDAAGGRIDGMQTPIDGSLDELPALLHDALSRWLRRRGTPRARCSASASACPAWSTRTRASCFAPSRSTRSTCRCSNCSPTASASPRSSITMPASAPAPKPPTARPRT